LVTFQQGTGLNPAEFNGYDPEGSFFPAGNIYSDSWAILGLKTAAGASNSTYYNAAVAGCKYLARVQTSGWTTYPLFNTPGHWFYYAYFPYEIGAALTAMSEVAYTIKLTLNDREGLRPVEGVPVQITNDLLEAWGEWTDAAGTVAFPALLDPSHNLTFQLSYEYELIRGTIVGATDASLVLEQNLETTPFGVDDPGLPGYGTAAQALLAADLTLSGLPSITSQIASEILGFSVNNFPLVLTSAQIGLFLDDGGELLDTWVVTHQAFDVSFEDVTGNIVLTGDISNNLPQEGLNIFPTMLAGAAQASPYTLSTGAFSVEDGKVLVPVVLSEITDGITAPKAIKFDFNYDSNSLSYTGL
ncbi:MAG TPA: hypothetical protein VJ417_10325, partial [Candidatus Glassbacteria bacterium]|nr:hypothetical protein [Candidatus Glassbacteria bacterium]